MRRPVRPCARASASGRRLAAPHPVEDPCLQLHLLPSFIHASALFVSLRHPPCPPMPDAAAAMTHIHNTLSPSAPCSSSCPRRRGKQGVTRHVYGR